MSADFGTVLIKCPKIRAQVNRGFSVQSPDKETWTALQSPIPGWGWISSRTEKNYEEREVPLMFTGKIAVRRLRSSEVGLRTVSDINHLLKSQHSKAEKVDEESLLAHLKRSRVVVAWNDDGRIIGMGVLVKVHAVSHTFGSIHNLIVQKGCDILSIGKQIVDLLINRVAVEFIEASVWPEDDDAINILTTVGFRLNQKLRYRLKARTLAAIHELSGEATRG